MEGSTWKESSTTTISSTSSFQKVRLYGSWYVTTMCSILTANRKCRCRTICDPLSLGSPTNIRTEVRRLLEPPYRVSKQTWPICLWLSPHGPKLTTLIDKKHVDIYKRTENWTLPGCACQHHQGRFPGLHRLLLQGVRWQGEVLDHIQRALEFQYRRLLQWYISTWQMFFFRKAGL